MPLTATGAISTLRARGEYKMPQVCDGLRQRTSQVVSEKLGYNSFDSVMLARPWVEAGQEDWEGASEATHTPFLIDYQLAGKTASTIVINQLYLPGWKIVVDGNPISRSEIERNLLPDGRMQINLPPGEWRVQAWYDGPPGWQIRNGLMLVLCLLAVIYWTYWLRSSP